MPTHYSMPGARAQKGIYHNFWVDAAGVVTIASGAGHVLVV
ncbi:hypothetical protein ApDm4_2806 [Acetobacter pomorum]|nr:hypothetical protein ApDm4_2806 [Acetobacter pomorum]